MIGLSFQVGHRTGDIWVVGYAQSGDDDFQLNRRKLDIAAVGDRRRDTAKTNLIKIASLLER